MNKVQALEVLMGALRDHQVVVCNGMIGREVFSLGDRPNHFYMIGSMGIAPSIALGLAHCAPHRKVAVFEGDGNTLMGLGNLAQVAADAPKNFLHICLDNGKHASTGGQRTISAQVALEKVALGAGYKKAWRADNAESLSKAIAEAVDSEGPVFLLAVVEPGTIPGVPRVDVTPPEITRRFQESVVGSPT